MLINENNNDEKNVLIIDDEDNNFFALAAILKAKGYRSLSAVNALEAFSILKTNNKIMAIVMDLMMPGLDGIEITESIKKYPRYQHIPVNIATDATSNDFKEKAVRAGADHYITKPIDVDKLATMLGEIATV